MKQRIDDQQAYLLHTYPYSETSLILEVFSRDHGRLSILARGARRPRSALRGVLLTFQPLSLGWFGKGEVKTLAKAEWQGGVPLLKGRCLILGYYLNELLLKLMPREDAHPVLFEAYAQAVVALANGGSDAPELRKFEKHLLRELGYGLSLEREADTGQPVVADEIYQYLIERGVLRISEHAASAASLNVTSLSGKTLLDLAADDYSDPRTLAESKNLMRQLLSHYLNGKMLQSRRVYMELQEL